MKRLSILGSTGSIGTSALEIVRLHPDRFSICSLTGATNMALLAEQVEEFKPQMVAVLDEAHALSLTRLLKHSHKPDIVYGQTGYIEAAAYKDTDLTLLAMVGAAGLKPALAAIEAGKQIALANKETLVMAGEIVMERARANNVEIRPVDSEHSAIYQSLMGNRRKDLSKIYLTASGGPFRTRPFEAFKDITLAEALNHPTWNMGRKITIDSATLMNKGLEIIEAVHLFDIPVDQIEVIVHPQSIIHSMVGYKDGTIIAQMGQPDMKGAIAFAMTDPARVDIELPFPDFKKLGRLTFEKPDKKKFPSLLFAYEACVQKGTMPCVFNAANEAAVDAFLNERIHFTDIFRLIAQAMELHTRIDNPDLSSIIEADCWARETVQSLI